MIIFAIIYTMLGAMGVGASITNHGNEQKPVNAWSTIIVFIIGQVLIWTLYLTK